MNKSFVKDDSLLLKEVQCLLVFMLKLDDDDHSLANNSEIIKQLALCFKKISVFVVHRGSFTPPGNVNVYELGGGSLLNRVSALSRLMRAIVIAISNLGSTAAFHHMSTRTLLWPGLILKALRIRQGLWYSHSIADRFLKTFAFVPDIIFTPGEKSFPLADRSKSTSIGHTVDFKSVLAHTKSQNIRFDDVSEVRILSVGRISRIKNYESMIGSIARTVARFQERELNLTFTIIGPTEDVKYAEELLELARRFSVNFRIEEAVPRLDLRDRYSITDIYYQGTPQSVDKATLEACSNGCLLVTINLDALELTGMNKVFSSKLGSVNQELDLQLETILEFDSKEIANARFLVSNLTIRNNDCRVNIEKMASMLRVQK